MSLSTYENRGAEEQIFGGRPTLPTQDPRVLPIQIRDLYTQSEQYRLAFSANWFLNIAFFMGFQNMTYSWSRQELMNVNNPGGFMVVANRIMPAVRTFVANLLKNKPTINAIAPTSGIADVNSGEITEALMQYWYRNRNLQEIYEEAVQWAAICGTSFLKLQWNPSIGPQQTYQPLMIQQTQGSNILGDGEPGIALSPSGEAQRIFSGDVDVEVLSPFEVHLVPHTVAHWRQVRAIIQCSIKHVDWIADHYEKGNEVRPESGITLGGFYQQRLRGLVSPDFAEFVGAGNIAYKDHAFLMEYRELKSRQFPKGRQVTVSNGVMLEDRENPYSDIFPEQIELGYIPVHCIRVPGRFWDIGLVEPLRPLQVEYNKVRTEIVKNRITVGRNKILAPKGSGIQEDDWANFHGIIIPYNKGFEPQVMPAVPLPAQTENELQYNMRDMDDVAGIHEISRGINPNPVRAGLHANILLEADASKVGPIIYGLERSIYRVNLGLVAMAKKFYTEKRTVRIVGEDKSVQVFDFLGADLTLDLELVPGSAFPRSQAAQEQTVIDLWREGLFMTRTGQPDYRRVFQLLKLGGISPAVTEEEQDRKNQAWENAMFFKGMYSAPRDFDDHIVHLEELDRYMKRHEYRFLAQKVQMLFIYHKQQHHDLMLQQLPPSTMMPNAAPNSPIQGPGPGMQPPGVPPSGMVGRNAISRPSARMSGG